ncbi:alpha/beta fold hydrolase [Streptomyces sp. TRM43335]|uniref:Alpha/beta fold hydrolase n=1 Tax=Streptomyces taklimakanensis TaxID=2569853 RepID=A0A6G2BE91_9ACTN|nr:alpha/beta hydrolase [Streptomyces taklimakanensis]MTE20222.1 alpha/beta fold hydrolase [Streptomyces taklimakanensis]
MDTRRLLRTGGIAFAAAALLLSGCSDSGGPDRENRPDASSSAPLSDNRVTGAARALEPLPREIPAGLRPYYEQKPDWKECGVAGFQCAELRVPLDYDKPEGTEELKLAVTRKKATGPGRRLGTLHVNPGGPGGSAVDYVQNAAGVGYPAPVRARYDIVGMDPRGVAGSEPIECLTDDEMDSYVQTDVTPDDRGEVEELVGAFEEFAKGCEKREGGLLGHVSTIEAARDLDILREVLGDDKLTYVGASYGTFLGATYAGLFPHRVGRLVLDGAMDPSLGSRQLNLDQTAGFQTAFRAFLEDCVRRDDCPLGSGSTEEAAGRLDDLLKELDARPIGTGTSRKLTESLATTGVLNAMYTEYYWPRLRSALTAARDGDGAELLTMADEYYDRAADGSYGNIMYANPAVNCLDLPAPFKGPDEAEKAVADFRRASSVFGRNFAWTALNCTYWQHPPTGEPRRIEAKGAAPILVIGTTRDPATPYKWAEGLAEQLSSGTLLTYDGDGHTAYVRGSDCVDSAVNDYLLRGKVPEDGTRCS